MITKQVIDTLYKQYPKRPKSVDDLDMALLFEGAGLAHDISVDIEHNEIVIGSIDSRSVFHRVHLPFVHAIVPFVEWVAIVLHSSVIFLNRNNNKVSIHLREPKRSVKERIKGLFGKE